MLVKRRRLLAGDQGSTLISVLIVMLVLSVLAMVGAAVVMGTTRTVAGTQLSSQARASADAGISAVLAAFKRDGKCPTSSPSSSTTPVYTTSCTILAANSQVRFTARGLDTSLRHEVNVEAVYGYEVPSTGGTAEGAIVSGDPTMNVSSITISADDHDGHIILNLGNFDCNNTMEMDGNLIVRNGNVSLSNNCKIHGNVFASGTVSISNAGVRVDGDVIALGNFSMSYGTVGGNVLAAGTVKMPSNATVVGAVVAASTADSSFYKAKAGSISIAGRYNGLQESTVLGSVSSSRAGVANEIAPNTTIGGSLTLAGTISTWGAGPVVAGVKQTNASGLVAPAVTAPLPLQPEGFTWIDYDFDPTEWEDIGYTISTTSTNCNYQGNTALINAVNNLTAPTVIDARGCTKLNLYDVTFNLKTDLLLVARKFDSAQRLKINSADGAAHKFSMITPDNTPDWDPTCAAGYGTMTMPDIMMGANITGIAYSPCTIQFGQSSGWPSKWNGQIYAGSASWAGNSVPNMALDYVPAELPGFVVAGSDPETATKQLKELIRRRDT